MQWTMTLHGKGAPGILDPLDSIRHGLLELLAAVGMRDPVGGFSVDLGPICSSTFFTHISLSPL